MLKTKSAAIWSVWFDEDKISLTIYDSTVVGYYTIRENSFI